MQHTDVQGDVQCGEEEERGERHHTLGVVSRTVGGDADVGVVSRRAGGEADVGVVSMRRDGGGGQRQHGRASEGGGGGGQGNTASRGGEDAVEEGEGAAARFYLS